MAPGVVLIGAVSGNLDGVAEIISQSDRRALDLAVSALKSGELVVYPTDTVYGLGAATGNEEAVRRLFVAKGRSPSKAVPLLVADALMATWVADGSDARTTIPVS